MTENLGAYLRKHWLYAFITNATATFIIVIVVNSPMMGSLEGNGAVSIAATMGIIWSLFLTACSASIFLNLYAKVRNNKIYVFFSYFIPPIIAALLVGASVGSSNALPSFIAVNIPFFVTQTVFCIKFLKVASQF
jgi:hypothetical protein